MAGKKERFRSVSQTPCLKGGTQVPEFLGVSNSDQFWSYWLRSSSWEMWFQMTYRNPCEEVQDWNTAHWSMTVFPPTCLWLPGSLWLTTSTCPLQPIKWLFLISTCSFKTNFLYFPENRVRYLDLHLSPSAELSFWNLRASTDFKEGTIKLTLKKPPFTDLISRQKFKWVAPLLGVPHEEEKDEQIFSEMIVP